MKTVLLATALMLTLGTASAQQTAPATSAGAADNTNSRSSPTFQGWMSDYSKANKGYISRQAYMDEMGRRWDAMDRSRNGLTMDQVNSMYGYSGANPGMVKRQTNATNPTGTEPKGQNSRGK